MRSRNQSSNVLRVLMASVIILGAAVYACAATEQVIYPFSFFSGGGAVSPGPLVFDRAGNLYGSAGGGGIGFGAIFELSPSPLGGWTMTILHDFSGNAADGGNGDGAEPSALIFDAAGNLYGVTAAGGGSGCGGPGCGVIFELSPTSSGWMETILYTFTGGGDGGSPDAITMDVKGNLYGVTYRGGSASNYCNHGCGTVFRLARTSSSWSFRVLHTFTGAKDGGPPVGLAIHSGVLYGATQFGGNSSCVSGFASSGCGTVFTITPTTGGGAKFGIIHTFSGGSDGDVPDGGLIFDRAGNAYGATGGGGSSNAGVVFKLEPGSTGWTETILHNFGGGSDGFSALGALTLDKAGNIYGTTALGSSEYDDGIVFELLPQSNGSWTEAILYTFTGLLDGQNPSSGVIFDTKGNLYGSTSAGGSGYGGIVYEITP